ncbi:MAG TPA: acyl-CoA thioesterase/bile acid-CoA:amino acid N-acyltransferase family protein [Rhodanobacteraceae bacterium]|nr:acyl-CoA thioesterase/bile acid-CoA:amino acid N-acyltransferase family protein [Rhodanobacteraceae bacterium]
MDTPRLSRLSALACLLFSMSCALPALAASLDVQPLVSRADAQVEIRATGLQPGALATISATTRDSSGQLWRSAVTCKADSTGVVDLAQCTPVGTPASTYSKADPMGLFWSMRQQDGAPFFFQFPDAPDVAYVLTLAVNGKVIQRVPIIRQLMADDVVREKLSASSDGVSGVVFQPVLPAHAKHAAGTRVSKRFPAVILLGGSGGGHPWDDLAALLASHGYVTLSLAYYNGFASPDPPLPDDLVNIPVETVGRALAWLEKDPEVDTGRIAIVGHSRGSELALLSAVHYPAFKAVVVLAGSPVAWPGIDYRREVPAWTFGKKPVPFLPSMSYFARAYHEHKPPITAFEEALDDQAAVQAAFIPIQRIDGPILFLGGDADEVWPSRRMAAMAMAWLHRHHHRFADSQEMFPDAGHFFFQPYTPVEHTVDWTISDPQGSTTIHYGGTLSGDAHTAPQAWARIIEFLHASLARHG